jgi:hypothetical protein
MFKTMLFSNSQPQRSLPNMSAYSANLARTPAPSRPMSLSAPMVNRVHAAKPGCSACGKRVA